MVWLVGSALEYVRVFYSANKTDKTESLVMKFGKSAAALLFASASLLALSGGALAQTVTSSWYSARASNHVASNEYPVGTRLRLYNTRNGRTAEGVVAGTGPFIRGRRLDVSRQLASRLDFIHAGTAQITVTRMGR
jgi:rare lipoprotein A